jgi:hypothetical protein
MHPSLKSRHDALCYLHRRRSQSPPLFEHLLVFQAVWRPWHGFEALVLDRRAVNDAQAERPILDPFERGPHLREDGGIGTAKAKYSSFNSSAWARSPAED